MRYIRGLVIVDWSPVGFAVYPRRGWTFPGDKEKVVGEEIGFGPTEEAAFADLLKKLGCKEVQTHA